MSTMHITTGFAVCALLAAGSLNAAVEINSFQTLDTDANGYISAEEATSNEALHSRWNTLDKDSDNQLDKAEFSAFEIDSTPAGDNMGQEGVMKETTIPAAPTDLR